MGDDPSKDAYVLGRDFPKVAEIKLDARYNPKLIIVAVANGDGGEFAHYVIGASGSPRQITHFDDKVVAVTADADGALYLVSRKGAPHGKLLKLDPGVTDLSRAAAIVPESDGVMLASGEFGGQPVVVTPDALYLREIVGGPSRVAIFDHAGKPAGTLPLPDVASVDEVEPLSDGTLLYDVATYLRPPYFSRYDPTHGQSVGHAACAEEPGVIRRYRGDP